MFSKGPYVLFISATFSLFLITGTANAETLSGKHTIATIFSAAVPTKDHFDIKKLTIGYRLGTFFGEPTLQFSGSYTVGDWAEIEAPSECMNANEQADNRRMTATVRREDFPKEFENLNILSTSKFLLSVQAKAAVNFNYPIYHILLTPDSMKQGEGEPGFSVPSSPNWGKTLIAEMHPSLIALASPDASPEYLPAEQAKAVFKGGMEFVDLRPVRIDFAGMTQLKIAFEKSCKEKIKAKKQTVADAFKGLEEDLDKELTKIDEKRRAKELNDQLASAEREIESAFDGLDKKQPGETTSKVKNNLNLKNKTYSRTSTTSGEKSLCKAEKSRRYTRWADKEYKVALVMKADRLAPDVSLDLLSSGKILGWEIRAPLGGMMRQGRCLASFYDDDGPGKIRGCHAYMFAGTNQFSVRAKHEGLKRDTNIQVNLCFSDGTSVDRTIKVPARLGKAGRVYNLNYSRTCDHPECIN